MVRPLKRPIYLVAPNITEENRRFEINRFRNWYIAKHTSGPPPGFANIGSRGGRWPSEPPPTNEVNAAVSRFLRDGFRYPGYPFSNF